MHQFLCLKFNLFCGYNPETACYEGTSDPGTLYNNRSPLQLRHYSLHTEMAFRLFETKEHASLYEKYMIRESEEVQRLFLSYLQEKKGKPFGLAVDIGCGTGQSTRTLGPYFQKVVGVDISEAQIKEARRVGSAPNVSYMVAAAEDLPFDGQSVDLVTVSVAAHWFEKEVFLRGVDRILKPKGCLALYSLKLQFELIYSGCSERLTDAYMEAAHFLLKEHDQEKTEVINSEYKELFDAMSYADKTRVSNIPVKRHISIAQLMGFTESSYVFQTFFRADEKAAKIFLQSLQERLLMIMGVSSTGTEIEICTNYFCILATKPVQ